MTNQEERDRTAAVERLQQQIEDTLAAIPWICGLLVVVGVVGAIATKDFWLLLVPVRFALFAVGIPVLMKWIFRKYLKQ